MLYILHKNTTVQKFQIWIILFSKDTLNDQKWQ